MVTFYEIKLKWVIICHFKSDKKIFTKSNLQQAIDINSQQIGYEIIENNFSNLDILKCGFDISSDINPKTNKSYYQKKENQEEACRILQIPADNFAKTVAYTNDKYQFGLVSSWINFLVTMLFLAFGGLGLIEEFALRAASNQNPIYIGDSKTDKDFATNLNIEFIDVSEFL